MPAAGRGPLTRLYDPAIALTMRQRAVTAETVATVLAAAPRPHVILDVGCGTGTLAVALARADPSLEIVGVDGDQEVLARAHAKTATLGSRVRFTKGLAQALPVADQSVDAAVVSLLLHHLAPEAKLQALREIRRALRAGGRMTVLDWGAPHDRLMRAAFLSLQLLDGFANTRDHVAGRLPSVIAQAGFSSVAVERRWRTVWGSLELICAQS